MHVYPEYIAPLFNKYTPLDSGDVFESVKKLADDVSFPLTKLFVVDGSTRSAHSNAYFYGFFKNKRIVLFDTLVNQVDTAELKAILGHEIGHWKLWHSIQGFVIAQLYLIVMLVSYSLVQNSASLISAFGLSFLPDKVPVLLSLFVFQQVIS
jgi:STE24 endopeptidase